MNKIIEGCKKNDHRAQHYLFEKYRKKLFAICRKYTSDDDTAKEMLQLGFIKIFEKIKTFDGIGSFEAWMSRIVRNAAIDYYRLLERRNEAIGEILNLSENDEPVELEHLNKVCKIILHEVEKLPLAKRCAFQLHVIEGKGYREIGDEYGLSESTVKANYCKARKVIIPIIIKKMKEQKLYI